MPECRACHAPLTWAITPTGKRSPIDEQPASAGSILLTDTLGEEWLAIVLSGKALELAREQHLPLYTSHFASCPHADEFRKVGSSA